MTDAPGLDFQVKKDDWRQSRFVARPVPGALEAGQALLRVDRFAFTANNITYAVAGDMLNYWGFFPAEEGWGRLPVMGYAEVADSRSDALRKGQRVFGFLPMSRYLTIDAQPAGAGVVDAAPHRSGHAPAYRQYTPVTENPGYRPEREDFDLLLRGLFTTGFLIDDFLAEASDFGAGATLVTSASSKTSIALAFLISRAGRGRVVGLTSKRNRAFVEKLGCYHQVALYDELESLPPGPVVLVDMAGDAGLRASLHRRYGEGMRHSAIVGATHWQAPPNAEPLPGAQPELFFAPAQLGKRGADWGGAELARRLSAGLGDFFAYADGWLRAERSLGEAAVESVYRAMLEGHADPSVGHVLSLWEGPERTAG